MRTSGSAGSPMKDKKDTLIRAEKKQELTLLTLQGGREGDTVTMTLYHTVYIQYAHHEGFGT